jgi:hypothetical protein
MKDKPRISYFMLIQFSLSFLKAWNMYPYISSMCLGITSRPFSSFSPRTRSSQDGPVNPKTDLHRVVMVLLPLYSRWRSRLKPSLGPSKSGFPQKHEADLRRLGATPPTGKSACSSNAFLCFVQLCPCQAWMYRILPNLFDSI